MALSLRAEQKSIESIFSEPGQYVIPPYQRPYSWEYDQCFQLYNDLLNSFFQNQDYFIGNLIIAKSQITPKHLEVVDGQQRLVTLLLLIKVLSEIQPEIIILPKLLSKEDWKGRNKIPTISTEVFESNDSDSLNKILKLSKGDIKDLFYRYLDKQGKIIERKIGDKFVTNFLYLYQWIEFYNNKNDNLEDFTFYLLNRVYLLPIELGGVSQDEANEKALIIFETINNRGMNLEDADIFKAKLYNKAKRIGEAKIFIDQWTEFKGSCDSLNLKIDDIFRYYSHIIRGREGITSSEKSLRDFFINENFSPLESKDYKEVLYDLFKILEIIDYTNKERTGHGKATPWLQVIHLYTNQYPKYAIVNFLFINGLDSGNVFIPFLKSLIRFVYYQGSTSTVKFEIYSIIKQTSQGLKISEYINENITSDFFHHLGRLKQGFVLLAHYLTNEKPLAYFSIDRLISLSDRVHLEFGWNDIEFEDIIDDIGNYLVLEFPKKDLSLYRKLQFYSELGNSEVQNFLNRELTFKLFIERSSKIKNNLTRFFTYYS